MDFESILKVLKKPDLTDEEKAEQIFALSLKPMQLAVYNAIPYGKENAVTCKEIQDLIGYETKNISSAVNALILRFPIETVILSLRKARYYKV